MKIGNKHQFFRRYCSACGKELKIMLAHFYQPKVYCNMKCRDVVRRTYTGEKSASYKRINYKCDNCNKDIMIIPYDYNKVNSFGDSHHFCSQKCYWEFRKKYYIQDKHHQYGKPISSKQRKILKENSLKAACNGKKITSIHKKINQVLNDLNIPYKNEKIIKYYAYDIYLPDENLMIEIMGDYFHASPLKYKKEFLNDMQRKNIKRDKSKHTYLKKYYNIEILYLWENDINKNIELCKKLILEYINDNGNLLNYDSFNYTLDDNKLLLNNKIINKL